jgi:hypothetical protein
VRIDLAQRGPLDRFRHACLPWQRRWFGFR